MEFLERSAATCLFYFEDECPLLREDCDVSTYSSLNSVEVMPLETGLSVARLMFKNKTKMRTVLQLLKSVGCKLRKVEEHEIVIGTKDSHIRQHALYKQMDRNMHSNARRDFDRERYVEDGLVLLRNTAAREHKAYEGAKSMEQVAGSSSTSLSDARLADLVQHEADFRREREAFLEQMKQLDLVRQMRQQNARLVKVSKARLAARTKEIDALNARHEQETRRVRAAMRWQRAFYRIVMDRRRARLEEQRAELERDRAHLKRRAEEIEQDELILKRRKQAAEQEIQAKIKEWDREMCIMNTKSKPNSHIFDDDARKANDAMDWVSELMQTYCANTSMGTMQFLKKVLRIPAFRKDTVGILAVDINSDTLESANKVVRRMRLYYHPDKQNDPILNDLWRMFADHMTKALNEFNEIMNQDFRPSPPQRLFPLWGA